MMDPSDVDHASVVQADLERLGTNFANLTGSFHDLVMENRELREKLVDALTDLKAAQLELKMVSTATEPDPTAKQSDRIGRPRKKTIRPDY